MAFSDIATKRDLTTAAVAALAVAVADPLITDTSTQRTAVATAFADMAKVVVVERVSNLNDAQADAAFYRNPTNMDPALIASFRTAMTPV